MAPVDVVVFDCCLLFVTDCFVRGVCYYCVLVVFVFFFFFFFQAEAGIRVFCLSRGLGDVYKSLSGFFVFFLCPFFFALFFVPHRMQKKKVRDNERLEIKVAEA